MAEMYLSATMEAFSMQNPNYHSGNLYDPISKGTDTPNPEPENGELFRWLQAQKEAARNSGAERNAAGLAAPDSETVPRAAETDVIAHLSDEKEKEISAILAEVAAERNHADRLQATDSDSGDSVSDAKARAAVTSQPRAGKTDAQKQTRPAVPKKKKPSAASGSQPRKKRKKRRKHHYTFKEILKGYIPWPGDSVLDAFRKIVFFAALCVVGICTFLISNYYIGLYHDKEAYEDLHKQLEENRNLQPVKEPEMVYDPDSGDFYEYFENMNELGVLLQQNPDLIGHIKIEGTPVDYPVVQKRSSDPNQNTNDYYLHRNFAQESSESGCIFLDFRCVFDRVVNHRRILANSNNLIVYGHNMNNKTMFGSLRDYERSPIYYKEHPIVEFQSLYKTYYYKIFAIFIVDGTDFTSDYAFDCWNTIDFSDEDEFYEYVNNAKKRNMISNDVDVVYGDPILTLYTCNSMITKEGKLILMCRMIREDEKGHEKIGTENAALNDNVLYPAVYYKNHEQTFDLSKFVPYGPKKESNESNTNSN